MGRLLPLAPFPAIYLLAGFVAWDWNPGNWDAFGRASAVMIAATIAFPIFIHTQVD